VTSDAGDTPRKNAVLPLFVGPAGSAKEIAIQYQYFKRSLAATGRVPMQVQLSARHAWQVRLDSGLVIALGREHIESRLDRFIATYGDAAGPLQRKLDYVDLRYSNGFAVRAPETKAEPRSTQPTTRNTKRG
jgi:cell division protein FtsQ